MGLWEESPGPIGFGSKGGWAQWDTQPGCPKCKLEGINVLFQLLVVGVHLSAKCRVAVRDNSAFGAATYTGPADQS